MEPTSPVSPMSSPEDAHGWQPPFAKLRRGQVALYELLNRAPKTQYSLQFPTGYGKTWCAGIAFATLRSQARISRCLVIVPQRQQLDQYLQDFPADLQQLGIIARGVTWCDGTTRPIREHRRNEKDLFLTTVQGIASDPAYYADLMSQGQWLIIADEFHHYANENTWGSAIAGLRHEVLLGMSATPLRADGRDTLFGGACDLVVTIEQARDEKAIRVIEAKVSDYFLDITKEDTGEVVRMTLSDLEDEARSLDISEWETQKKIRYHSKYLSTLLLDALSTLHTRNIAYPGQHQMLVFAMSCRHAQHVTEVLNALAQDKSFAQWIGEGPNGRDTKENERIIQAFHANDIACLVQVNKAGEGFNNKRCSVGVFLNLIGDTPMARQQIGRFMRRNTAITPYQEDYATILVSQDAKILPLLRKYEEATQAEQEERFLLDDDTASCESCALRLFRIPEPFHVDLEFKDVEIVWPYGSPEAAVAAYRPHHPAFAQASLEELIHAMRVVLAEQQHPRGASEKDRLRMATQDVQQAVSMLASNVLRLRLGESFEKSMLVDVIKRVHWEWTRKSGVRHEAMTHAEFLQKFRWVQEVNERLRQTREVPAWLTI